MPTISPNEAAKRTSQSRRTIMRAIAKGELPARRTNEGWQIEETDLTAWADAHRQAHAPADARAQPDVAPSPTAREAVLEERIRALEMLLTRMQTANDDLRADRDRWHQFATRPWWKRMAG